MYNRPQYYNKIIVITYTVLWNCNTASITFICVCCTKKVINKPLNLLRH